jgi:tRNA (cmo5U34)-methyltransferase
MTVGDAFDASVAYYDDWVRQALPDHGRTFAVATGLIPFDPGTRIDVLDLGAGTGLFSQHVLKVYPLARFVLYDVAPGMLDVARTRFHHRLDQFQFVVQDYRDLRSVDRFDVAISSLSIHHLQDGEKRKLFRQVYAALRDGGVFVNVDQVKGPTPELQTLYWSNWLDMVRQRGAEEGQIQDSIERRQAYDRDALLVDQLRWLDEAGFVDVDCVYKDYFVGVFVATKH